MTQRLLKESWLIKHHSLWEQLSSWEQLISPNADVEEHLIPLPQQRVQKPLQQEYIQQWLWVTQISMPKIEWCPAVPANNDKAKIDNSASAELLQLTDHQQHPANKITVISFTRTISVQLGEVASHNSQPSTAPPQSACLQPVSQTMMFRDQVGVLASWFKGWNECEQTVALLSLLKRVSRTQARFLQLCLEHSLAECAELQVLEGEANNPGRTSAKFRHCYIIYWFMMIMFMYLLALIVQSH